MSEFNYRLSDNTTTALFNPEFVTGLSVGFAQNILNGYGKRANARFIRIRRNNLQFSMSVFRQSVIAQVATVMTTYYNLLTDQESIRVAQEGLTYAQKLLENNKAELKIGAVSQYDVLLSEQAAADQQQALIAAQTPFRKTRRALCSNKGRNGPEPLGVREQQLPPSSITLFLARVLNGKAGASAPALQKVSTLALL